MYINIGCFTKYLLCYLFWESGRKSVIFIYIDKKSGIGDNMLPYYYPKKETDKCRDNYQLEF